LDIRTYDLVCIGGGGAAILAAVYAASEGKSVALVTKDYPGGGNTRLAVGMTACPGILDNDSADIFSADLLRSGEGINEPAAVKTFAGEAARHVAALEELGPIFRRDSNGIFGPGVVAQIGGHSKPRSIKNLGGGVSLGASLKTALWRYGVTVYSYTAALELLKVQGRVIGLLALDLRTGIFLGLDCCAVLIATGGCGALYYPHTTNSRGAVGDGLALGLKAGAVLWDMEQVQAIPFGLTRPRSMIGALCGEPSTAGPAGRLLDGSGNILIDGGINKMTRAAVTRIMMSAINEGKTDSHGGLLLDLRPNLSLANGEKIYRVIRSNGMFNIIGIAYGIKAYHWEEPWSVMPTYHYQMGGIKVNRHGETGVSGLLAAGEVQAGLHGGNRLGSVALSEIYTVGTRAGIAAGSHNISRNMASISRVDTKGLFRELAKGWKEIFSGKGQHNPERLRANLEGCMWQLAGPVKKEAALLKALEELDRLSAESKNLKINQEKVFNRQILDTVELHLMLPAARALVLSALERKESRGAHLRSEYPAPNDKEFKCHTYIRMSENGSMESGLAPLES